MSETALRIREAAPADAGACAAVYAPYVTGSAASFEATPPDAAEMRERMGRTWCWLVAELHGDVVGYAYGSPHRERAAYRWAGDVTVYVDARAHRRGIGRALYGELIPRLRALGLWTLCAGVTEPNPASIGLHEAVGFRRVGTYRRIGWKAGAWHDVTWLQLQLREDDARPSEPGRPAA